MERRKLKRNSRLEATRSLLTTVKNRLDYAALQLSHAGGDLIANAPSTIDERALAMVARLAGTGHHRDPGLLDLITGGAGLRVWEVSAEQENFFLCAVGGPEGPPKQTIKSLERIINQNYA